MWQLILMLPKGFHCLGFFNACNRYYQPFPADLNSGHRSILKENSIRPNVSSSSQWGICQRNRKIIHDSPLNNSLQQCLECWVDKSTLQEKKNHHHTPSWPQISIGLLFNVVIIGCWDCPNHSRWNVSFLLLVFSVQEILSLQNTESVFYLFK